MQVFDLLFPKRCVGCRKLGSYLCKTCHNALRPVTIQLCLICDRPAIGGATHSLCKTSLTPDGITAVYQFRSPVRELIHELKYKGVFDVVKLCAWLMVPYVEVEPGAIVMPVPLYQKKLRERGFNQSALLGKALAKQLHLGYADTYLKRVKATKTQAKLNRIDRKANVKDAFACIGKLDGKSILLIDDTVTTGSTLVACSNALKRAGAKEVWAVTLAQALWGGSNGSQNAL